jgi:DNA mismatch repair ATPase MutS
VGCGFYSEFSIHPYTHIHSYLNIPDTSGRDSLFQAEARRCKEIIDIIKTPEETNESRHFCIFDELYSGTNPVEATKSAYAFLLYLSQFKNVNFILTTHYTSICKKIKGVKRIRNYKMDITQDEDGNIKYTYMLKPGICKIEGAVEILKTLNYPAEIIETIKKYKL